MAEEFVSKDQHRADMAELWLELGNSLASLDKRTELIAQDLSALRREMNDRFDRVNEQMTERFDRMGQQLSELRQDNRHLQTAVQRQMWALIAVVAGGVIKILFFP